jgi:CheY-like chemotaxis protein/anti-sigma regulatory factor (Ser/Thr protein kinase)
VLAHAVEASRASIDARAHELTVELAPEELVVEGDFDRLAQIFSNLISNAAKYTHSGGRIRVRLAHEQRDAVVEVIDNGIGIPRDALEHVFDLFSQVREHQRHAEGGLGIGLSLVKTLVAHHGGSVSATSPGIDMGSTFTVRLPLLQSPASEAEPDPESHRDSLQSPHRVLVVDDNVDAAESMASLIALHGHDVELAHGGLDALDKAQRFHPDLVFLDLGMPDVDGFETARRLRATAEGKQAVLVAVTGWGQPGDRERTSAAGFDAHMVKPMDQTALLQAFALADRAAGARE